MKKTLLTSLLLSVLFLGASAPSGSTSLDSIPEVKPTADLSTKERLRQELDHLRINNSVTLNYIAFKIKFESFEKYYATDSVKN